jgi:3-deoxy-D-manno-octulosonate 8-phosphate phosphatase (KDO 8-P phosphatase)
MLLNQKIKRKRTDFQISIKVKQCIRKVSLIVFDFDGVFTDNKVYVFENGSDAVCCWRSDGIGLRKLDNFGISAAIVASEPNQIVAVRCNKLKILCIQSVNDKLIAIKTLAQKLGVSLQQVAFVGNDINDLQCLRSVGLPIVTRDAHLDVMPYAFYQTRTRGGHGAVREVCDLFESVLLSKHE